MVPNIEGTEGHKIKTRNHSRRGTHLVWSIQQTETQHKLNKNAVTVIGPCIYNLLPKYPETLEMLKLRCQL